ncbi:MAG: hypothetical protein RLZZ312_992, partial [Bacteroidota bacterium]
MDAELLSLRGTKQSFQKIASCLAMTKREQTVRRQIDKFVVKEVFLLADRPDYTNWRSKISARTHPSSS